MDSNPWGSRWAERRWDEEKPEEAGAAFQAFLTIIENMHDDPEFVGLIGSILDTAEGPEIEPLQIGQESARTIRILYSAIRAAIDAKMQATQAYDRAETEGEVMTERVVAWAKEMGLVHLGRGPNAEDVDGKRRQFSAVYENFVKLESYLFFLIRDSGSSYDDFSLEAVTREQMESAVAQMQELTGTPDRNSMVTALVRARGIPFIQRHWRQPWFPANEIPVPPRSR